MGFKEVMALRQENKLEEALVLAREDYRSNKDQWSASALFWVLKDFADKLLEAEKKEEILPYIQEMESIVPEMGATINVASEALEKLQKDIIPHYNELEQLAEEIVKTKRRDRVREIFETVMGWHQEAEGNFHTALHENFAQIILKYLDNQLNYMDYENFVEFNTLYLSLQNPKPSQLHSLYLSIALRAKEIYDRKMNLGEFLTQWDLVNLTPEDWKRNNNIFDFHSLAEKTLHATITEFLELYEPGKEVPAPVYQLLLDALSFYPDDELVQLTQARMHMIDGRKDQALEMYQTLLITIDQPRAWMEFASLVDDMDIKMGALCMALRKEDDDYQSYLLTARMELTKILIEKKLYENALRELDIVAQFSLEKAFELPKEYDELLKLIPKGTVADKNNRDFYYPNSRPAQEYIYAPIPVRKMLVLDIIAIKLKDGKQVVPMLKLIDTEGNTVLVSPKESGIFKGDNRGLCYDVKVLERPKRFSKVVLISLSEKQNPKELFPTMIGYINGYSQTQYAHHIMDINSRHHYLPGKENDYIFGEFIEFVHIVEYPNNKKKGAKGAELTSPREYLLLPSRLNPEEAITHFPIMKAQVDVVRDIDYILTNENGVRSFVNHSVSPVALREGDVVLVRGFQQRHKDKRSGEINYSYITLSIEIPSDEQLYEE